MTGHLIGVTGIPGAGKSHMIRSAAEVGKMAVALTDPKEASFYAGSKCDATVISDLDWRPHKGDAGRKASGYNELMAWLENQQAGDAEFVGIDTGTEATRLAEHEYLKMQGVFQPGDLEYGRGYIGPEQLIWAMVTELRRLAARGKTVLVSFHAIMKELEGAGSAEKKKAMSGETEWRFDEQLLPMCAGRNVVGQTIAASFDLWLYTVPSGFGPGRKFYVTALPDQVRPAKHSVEFKDGVNVARLPNTIKELLGALK